MKKYKTLFLAVLFAVLFSGCGGGGGSSGDITATLKLIRLDGVKINLTDRPIPLRVVLEATFSQAVDPSSVESGTSLVDESGVAVAGAFAWGSGNTVMTFTPAASLKYKTIYTVRITNTAAAMVVKAEGAAEQTFTTMTKGDVNADGVPDIIIGAYGANTNRGAAYVYSGAALTGTMSPTDALATINGQAAEDRLGGAVSLAGDVNGDGYEDVIIGANQAANTKGAVYIYSGSSLAGTKTTADALATVTGNADNDFIGEAVSGAGDINKDGYSDVLIGASSVNTGAGATYVFGGSSLSGPKLAGDALATINGTNANDNSGKAVSGIGDVNGDGNDDILIGAWHTPSGGTRGSAYVFSGAVLSGSLPVTDALAEINSGNNGDLFGASVSGAGDVNADGVPDIIIGAYNSSVGGPTRGSAYVFSGASLSGPKTLGEALANVNGQNDGDQLGISVSGAGDVNADGYDDVIIGANQTDAGGNNAGSAYVFSGAALTGPALATINGAADSDNLGRVVSGAGDVNFDGYSDILVGSQNIGALKGAVYLFHGASLTGVKQPANAIATIDGMNSGDYLASSLSGVSY